MKFKKYLPKKLFYRFLLIIALPIFIVQSLSTYIFYQTHIQKVVKKISTGTISNIILINKNFKPTNNYADLNLEVVFLKNEKIKLKNIIKDTNSYLFFNQEQFFIENILKMIEEPISLKKEENFFVISIQKPHGILDIRVNKKELIVKTAGVFMMWNIILSFLMIGIASIFLKNQLKPIKLLKKQVKNFSLNQKKLNFKPTGAKEIRELSLSFIQMEKRIKKFINQRTMILAGISHDLKTPLTRMKLELEMLNSSSKQYLSEDIDYMEKIINQYLNFAKTSTNEEKIYLNIFEYLNIFIKDYKKINDNLILKTHNIDENEIVFIQPISFKRALSNILNNAFKFGKKIIIVLSENKFSKEIIIKIHDNGKGVTKKELTKLTEPFYKTDKSRNSENNPGVGLGLSITQDIILANNATLSFFNSKLLSGLEVEIRLKSIRGELK